MLASVRWGAVLLGSGAGLLGLAAVSLLLWLLLSSAGVEGAAAAATAFGTVAGFGIGGWVAGRRALTSAWFHGALAALLIALAVLVTALRGGSPAPASQVLLLAALAIGAGGGGGLLGGRRS